MENNMEATKNTHSSVRFECRKVAQPAWNVQTRDWDRIALSGSKRGDCKLGRTGNTEQSLRSILSFFRNRHEHRDRER